jgi:hypothetical protein
MSFANNLKVIVSGTTLALSLAATGLAFAEQPYRADGLGQAIALKQEYSGVFNPVVEVKNQTHQQVTADVTANGRTDELGLAIAAKNETPVRVNSALAATKNTGSNHSGQ